MSVTARGALDNVRILLRACTSLPLAERFYCGGCVEIALPAALYQSRTYTEQLQLYCWFCLHFALGGSLAVYGGFTVAVCSFIYSLECSRWETVNAGRLLDLSLHCWAHDIRYFY